jgi:replication factor A2
VGHVVSSQKQATNIVYSLEDSTGRMEARKWVNTTGDDDGDKTSDIPYVLL